MSDIQRNIVTNWISRGAQGVRAQIGQVNSALLGLDRTEQRVQRSSSLLNNQLRALGTTIRYALSGFAVYGVLGAVQNLQTLQESMGSIAAIGETIRGTPLPTGTLNQMRDDILRISSEIATPAEEIANSITTIYSSLQAITPEQATGLARVFSVLERTTRTGRAQDVQRVGEGLLRTLTSFNIPTQRAPQTANQIFKFIQRSIGVTGEEFAQYTPQAFAGAQLAGINLPQLLSLSALMQRGGGTFALNQRQLAQLLRDLRTPRTKEAARAFAAIGLPRDALLSLPPMDIIQQIFEAIRTAGGVEAVPLGVGVEELPEGVRGFRGQAAGVLSDLFHRAESRRSIAVLFQQWMGQGPGRPGFEQLNREFVQAGKNSKAMSDAMRRNMEQIPITRLQQDWRDFFMAILTESDPVLKRLADLSDAAAEFVTGGTRQRRAVLGGAAGGLIALLLGRQLAGRGRLPGISSLGRLFGGGAAALSIAKGFSGEGGLGAPKGTVQDPIFVVVLYQLGGGGRGAPPVPVPGERGRGGRGRFPALGFGLGLPASVAAAVLATAGATRQPEGLGTHRLFNFLLSGGRERMFDPNNRTAMRDVRRGLLQGVRRGFISEETAEERLRAFQTERRILRDYSRGYISQDVAEKRLRAFATRGQLSAAGVGRMAVEWGDKPLKIQITGKDLKRLQDGKKKTYHVTKDLFPSPVFKVPQNRGRNRPGNRRD